MVSPKPLTIGHMPLNLGSLKSELAEEALTLKEAHPKAKLSSQGSEGIRRFLEKNKSHRGRGLEKFFVESKKIPPTPEQRYQSVLQGAKDLAGEETDLIFLARKVGDLEAFGAKAGKSKAEIEKEKRTIYASAYETRRKALMDKARRGREDFTFLKEFSQMVEYGRKAGKTSLEISRDKKKIYQEFFDWAYGEADQWAERLRGGPHFKNRLDDMDRYGALAGLLPFDIARLKQTIFKTLYETSLKKLRSDLLTKGCNNPDKEIIFGGGFLEIQGANRSEILAYGAAAGLAPADVAKDIDSLKSDLKAENERRMKKSLHEGAHRLVNAPKRAAKKMIQIPFAAGQEVGRGIHQIAEGVERFVKGLI